MPNFTEAAGRTVAADIQTVFASFDGSLLDASRLTISFMEGLQGSRLHPARAQRVLDHFAASFAGMVQSRKDMVSAHLQLIAIKNESNLKVHDFGCTEGPLWAQLRDAEQMEEARD